MMSYADDLAIITVLVTHLGTCKLKSKSAHQLAVDLTLYLEEVKRVLKFYPELFVVAGNSRKFGGEKTYTLHLRYALRWSNNEGEGDEGERPIDAEHLCALLGYIGNRVSNEVALKRQIATNYITISCAFIATLAAILSAFN